MPYITVSQATQASRSRWMSRAGALTEIRKSASASARATFDVFLSHAYEDAEVVAGVKALLEDEGLSAYVDWLDDPQASRDHVTPKTAELLRSRMRSCSFLLFLTSKASPDSRWMPWELGYFDGYRPGKVGVLPVVQSYGQPFTGQEYLGLYPNYEGLGIQGGGYRIARSTDRDHAVLLSTDARRMSTPAR